LFKKKVRNAYLVLASGQAFLSSIIRRLAILGIGFLLTAGILGLAVLPSASAEAPGTWTQTTQYPFDAYATSCAASSSTIVCVGGYDSSLGTPADVSTVEYATLSGSGISSWTATTSYPTTIYVPSCATSGGYIYCVGGAGNGETTDAVYYASVSGSGVGTWVSTTDYPIVIEGESCVISAGYITCVGGTSYDDTGIASNVYSAPVSSSGVGAWTEQTDYACTSTCLTDGASGIATADLACVVTGTGTIYLTCIGGEEKIYVGGQIEYDYPQVGSAFSATLSSGAVGSTWTQTTTLSQTSVSGAGSCVSANNYVYCLAGYDYSSEGDMVWYAQSTSGALGTWTQAADYGELASTEQCVVYSGDIYCTTGIMAEQDLTPYSYYTTIATSTSSTSSTTSSSSTTTSSSTTSSTATSTSSTSTILLCPSTAGGVLMPVGATFTDLSGNVWVAPGGSLGGGTVSSYFFQGPESNVPPPMLEGWGGVYGTYGGETGWIISFFC